MIGTWIAGINPVEKICSGVPTVAGLDSLLTELSSLKTPLAKMAGARSDMGTANGARVRDLIVRAEKPMVVDADGLNILGLFGFASSLGQAGDCSECLPDLDGN